MPSSDDRVLRRLFDILENINAAREFVSQLSFEQFLSSRQTIYAVIRALEIISEASRHIPDAIKSRHPDIPWLQIKAAGNIYRHGYEEVSSM